MKTGRSGRAFLKFTYLLVGIFFFAIFLMISNSYIKHVHWLPWTIFFIAILLIIIDYKYGESPGVANFFISKFPPQNAAKYANLYAISYYKKGKHDQAIAYFNKAIELNSNYAEAYNNRAQAYYLKKDYDKAWQDLHRAEELGYHVNSSFLEGLKKTSGREK